MIPASQFSASRFLALFAFVALFFLISSEMRRTVYELWQPAAWAILKYAPYSYAGLVLASVCVFLVCLSRGSRVP